MSDHLIRFLALCMISWGMLSDAQATQDARRPNIVLIMADDVGIEGLGCYGGQSYRTPNLDRMAAEGIRFTHAYAQPLCTPTRVQIMTGKYNHRNWRSFGILDPNESTFGHYLQQAGYKTGIFGKWQLYSYDPPDLPGAERRRGTGMHPKDAGFDEYALYHALHTEDKGSRYANPRMLEGRAGDPGQLKTYHGRYGEDVWVEKIIDFMQRHRDHPTMVYYPMALPHWPFQPTPKSPDWDPTKEQPEAYHYITDMIEYMDTAVGNLLHGLQSHGLRENTIVLFYSDNGTHTKVVSQLRDGRSITGGKATPRQTGIHVPLIAHWPGHISPGISDAIIDASDFLPTLMELAGSPMNDHSERGQIESDPNQGDRSLGRSIVFDGISFANGLFGNPGRERKAAFFWYDPRPGWDKERFQRHVFAVDSQYKLFRSGRLFRLTDRPLEEIPVNPLAMSEADRKGAARLQAVIDHALAGVDEPPLVNAYGEPEHDLLYVPKDRSEAERIADELLKTGQAIHYGDPAVAEHRLWMFRPLDLKPADRRLEPDGEPIETRPCVVFVHGGGWGGHPRMLAPQCVYLQRLGYHTISIHFRRPDLKKGVTPADTLRDARRAYRWIVDHADEYQIDADRLYLSGGSAGGHLALALLNIGLDDDPVVTHRPRGFVLLNPVIDLVDGWPAGRRRCEAAGIDPASFSPAHHVRPDSAPVLILSGSEDELIPPKLIDAFVNRMQQAGNSCRAVIYPNAGHGFFNYGRHNNRYFQWTMWEFESFLQSNQ